MCGSSVLMLVFVRIRLTVLSTSPSFSFVLGDVTEDRKRLSLLKSWFQHRIGGV